MTRREPSSTSGIRGGLRASLLVAGIVAGFLAVDWVLAAALDAAYARSGASPSAVLRTAAAETVVVGTSTAKYAIYPAAWPDRMVNLAQDGQTVLFSIAAARGAAEVGSVRRIIVGIDPYDLASGLDNPAAGRVWRIAPSIAAIPELASLLADTRPDRVVPLPLQSWRFRGDVFSIMRRLGDTRPPAYKPLPPGTFGDPGVDEPGAQPLHIHASLDRYVAMLAETAKRFGAEIVLVVTPAYKNARWNRREQLSLIEELSQRMNGAPVCNLMAAETPGLEKLRLDAANFHDGVHLSESGARAYTRELARLVDERCGRRTG